MITQRFSYILLNSLRFLECKNYFKSHIRNIRKTVIKCKPEKRDSSFSNEKIIKSIKMAFTSHESTKSPPEQDKPPVIIMHGLLGSKTNWNTLSKVMHRITLRKIIAVDARNHGDSPHSPEFSYSHLAEDVRSLMENLSIPRASLIGHSMGGRVMMLTALKYPSLVEKLVIVDISPVGISPTLGVMKDYFDAMKKIKVERNIPISSARKSVDEQLKNAVPDNMLRSFLITNLIEDNGSFRWRFNLDAISENFFSHMVDFPMTTPPSNPFQGPTLFVGGGKSDFLRHEEEPQIKKYFPEAKFVYIPDAGHWVQSEKPNEFIRIVGSFLQGTSEWQDLCE